VVIVLTNKSVCSLTRVAVVKKIVSIFVTHILHSDLALSELWVFNHEVQILKIQRRVYPTRLRLLWLLGLLDKTLKRCI
jgi:hypothetical protein